MARILLIDDNEDIHRFVRYYVERAGHSLLSAHDADSGRTMTLEEKPDVVLLDRIMPGADGLELCRELKSTPGTCRVPVILVTVRGSVEDKIAGFEAGCDEYVTKPFDPRELLARITVVLRARDTWLEHWEEQQGRARAEAARQTFGALSHHIRNAIQVLLSAADNFDPPSEEGQAFREVTIGQAQRVARVIESLGQMVSQMKLKVVNYPGTRDGILDINTEIETRTPHRTAAAV